MVLSLYPYIINTEGSIRTVAQYIFYRLYDSLLLPHQDQCICFFYEEQ